MGKKSKNKAQEDVLKFVRQQCKSAGVRFRIVDFEEDNNYGVFEPNLKLLTVARKVRLNNKIKKIRKVPSGFLALNALHEWVHVLQWKRKNPEFLRVLSGEENCLEAYATGRTYYPKAKLKQALSDLIAMEWEAESISIRMADSFGLDLLYSRFVRSAKIYMYSFLVLVETGIYVSPNITKKWYKYFDSKLHLDLSKSLLKTLCSITIKNKESAAVIWKGRTLIKKTL